MSATLTSKKHDVDMTVGSIPGNIIKFALPLLAGNLFQQLYNMVDTWVIGRTGDNGAYAAVGSVGPIINMLIGFFMGLSSGAGVVISQYYGSKDNKRVHTAVHTSIALTLILAIAFTIIGVLITPFALNIMLKGTEDATEVYPHAKTYLTIYFSGVIGLMIYNMSAGILRAVGDSKRPFYFLVVSAVTNTVLDLVFVNVFGMGADGVALATIIAQALSAVLTVITLMKSDSVVRLVLKDIRVDGDTLKKIVKIGIPAAFQMALTSFSNIFVQSYVAGANGDQTSLLGGWTSYTKIDQFIFLPVQSISLAVTTFVGQNLGINNVKRAKRGTTLAYLMATGVTVAVIAIVMIFTPFLAGVFNSDENVTYYAKMLLSNLTPFYIFCCVNQVFSASLRGAGNTRAPMIIMLSSFVVFRQIYLFVVSNYISNDILPIAFSYPAGWFVCATLTLIYYKFCNFEKNRITA